MEVIVVILFIIIFFFLALLYWKMYNLDIDESKGGLPMSEQI